MSSDQFILNVSSPFGDQVKLMRFSGEEQFSTPFQYSLELKSDDISLDPKEIVGKPVGFSMTMGKDRPFHGYCNQFVAGVVDSRGGRYYQCNIVPWFWFLTRTTDCRIFQEMTVVEIVEEVFGELGFADYELQIHESHPKLEYCVQYRESDFGFVSRLLEREGIYYYFKHSENQHLMVLSDSKSGYCFAEEREIEYSDGSLIPNHISRWERKYEFRSGKIAQTDYNFQTPSTSLMTDVNTIMDFTDVSKFELFDYPGLYPDKDVGDTETRVRMEEEEVNHDQANARSGCPTLAPGHKFTLLNHASSDESNTYVITRISHWGVDQSAAESSDDYYGNTFDAILESVVYRPPRATSIPTIRGIQTAVVVGPSGEEIYPDEFGRIKVQFHWDRLGKNDEHSSCWIRVSQVHAGPSFGGIDLPRIGEEVIISFEEGCPDRPVVIGRLYNAEVMPPFPLPDQKVISGMKSNSTKGGGGYNEFVLDDTKGNELIRVHGQFDMDSTIENDLREHVLNDRSRDVTNNETIQIGNDRTESVGNNETLSVVSDRTRSVGKNESVTVTLTRTHNVGVNEMINIGAAQEINVGAVRSLIVGASQAVNIGVNLSEDIGKDQSTSVGKNRTTSVGENDALKVGKKHTVEAGEEILLKVGKASLLMKKDGTIVLEGKDITVKGSGKINIKASKNVIIKGQKILEN